ncbi:hypothetical protein [Gimesia alba]|uniref:hypothetical protein n=1 Tax=Gimesia alba TaxID=2527973 RepID=UPI0011A8B7A6|nr:hypothetical protein [Gimesia alba]
MLALRLIIVVSNSPSGWRSFRDDWEDQALRVLGRTTSIGEELPTTQAEYWLEQIKEIPATQNNPQVALGAAWMLAEPQYGFLKRNISSSQDLQVWSEKISETFNQSQEEYRAKCRDACLNQAAIATRLAPKNVDFWRQRALLLFAVRDDSEQDPYTDDWLQVLEEGAAHDPENALYDYLAASQFYLQSTETIWDEENQLTLKITNPRIYAQAEQRLQAGLKKPTLNVGTITWSATLEFVKRTSLPLEDQIKAAGSRNCSFLSLIIISKLQRWLNYVCESDLLQKKYSAVIRNSRREQRIAEQLTGKNNLYESTFFKYSFRTSALGHLFQVLQLNHESFTPAETVEIEQNLQQAWLKRKIFIEALDRYHALQDAQSSTEAPLAVTLTVFSQRFIVFLLPLSLLLFLLVRLTGWLAAVPPPRPGWWRTLIVWFSGVSLSLFIWGVIPADVLSEQAWNILLLGLCWGGLIMIMTVSLLLIHRRANLPWLQLISLLLFLAAPVLLCFQFTSLLAFVEQCWIQSPLTMLIPASLLIVVSYGVLVYLVSRFLHSTERSARRKLTVSGFILLVTLLVVPAGAEVFQASLNPVEMQTWFGREVSMEDANPFRMLAGWSKKSQKQIPKWVWIYPQWTTHNGEGFAIMLSLSILLGWSLLRWSNSKNNKLLGSTDVSQQPVFQQIVRLLKHSSLIALLVASTVYLAAVPIVIAAQNRINEKEIDSLLNPLHPLQEVDTINIEIKKNPVLIQSFEERIKEIQQRLIEEANRIGN